MIKESLKLHGNKQFEVKQRVSFPQDEREVKYTVETYFFLPSALQINEETYEKAEFQKHLKSYVRMRSPGASLKSILAPGGELEKLQEFLEDIPQEHTMEAEGNFEDILKRFSLTYKHGMAKKVKSLIAREDCSPESILQFLQSTKEVLRRYRSLRSVAQDYADVVESKTYDYCDEYLSIVTSYYLKLIYNQVPSEVSEKIREVWIQETKYQEEKYPLDVLPGETLHSAFLLRWSALKKFISSCLFLDIRYRKAAPLIKHSIYGFAAAISMLFATIVAFKWQNEYGSLSLNLFIALVIAYIFKDRIKEISRDWLSNVFRRWIPDRILKIYREPNIEVGLCKESFDFMPMEKIPQFVRELRANSHWINLVHDRRVDTVIRFKKQITIKNHKKLFETSKYSLLDITRFNIADFLRNIDGKFEELPVFSAEDVHIIGEKLYHIYILRVVTFGGKTDTEVVRVVVNVEGIKRIMLVKPLSLGTTDIETETSRDSFDSF